MQYLTVAASVGLFLSLVFRGSFFLHLPRQKSLCWQQCFGRHCQHYPSSQLGQSTPNPCQDGWSGGEIFRWWALSSQGFQWVRNEDRGHEWHRRQCWDCCGALAALVWGSGGAGGCCSRFSFWGCFLGLPWGIPWTGRGNTWILRNLCFVLQWLWFPQYLK